mmetsp:Transcript_37096/g.78301  ORF Transcript_37096/g.78301 Transcript_37096/m.78301 type:complete len:243 (+) Transcript_37096:557-1285(+)
MAASSAGLSSSPPSKTISPTSSSSPSSSKSIKASMRASFCLGCGDTGTSRGLRADSAGSFDGASSPNSSPILKALILSCWVLALVAPPDPSLPPFSFDEPLAVCFEEKSRRRPIVGPERGVFSSSLAFASLSSPPFFSSSACFFIFSSRLWLITSQNRESRCNMVSYADADTAFVVPSVPIDLRTAASFAPTSPPSLTIALLLAFSGSFMRCLLAVASSQGSKIKSKKKSSEKRLSAQAPSN